MDIIQAAKNANGREFKTPEGCNLTSDEDGYIIESETREKVPLDIHILACTDFEFIEPVVEIQVGDKVTVDDSRIPDGIVCHVTEIPRDGRIGFKPSTVYLIDKERCTLREHPEKPVEHVIRHSYFDAFQSSSEGNLSIVGFKTASSYVSEALIKTLKENGPWVITLTKQNT